MASRILFHFQRLCCAIALWFPRIGVNFLTTWAIYVLLFKLAFSYYNGIARWMYTIGGLFVYINTTISYYRTVKRSGGSPLDIPGFRADPNDIEAGTVAPPPQVFNNVTAKDNGEMRFCSKCNCWKPDRTHHCRTCNRCILRMDHHCPWFSSCIGYTNHKFFVQFLVYVTLQCIISFAASMIALVQYFKDEEYLEHYPTLNWIALALAGGVMGLAVGVFTGYSLYLVFKNQTTLEMMETVRYKSNIPSQDYRYGEAPSSHSIGNVFDIGTDANWRQIMGDSVFEWIFPIVPKNMTEGTSFPVNEEVWEMVQTSANSELSAIQRQRMYIQQQREIQRRHIEQTMVMNGDDEDDYVDFAAANPREAAESIPLTRQYN